MKLADGSYLTTPAFVVNDIEDGGLGLKGNEATVFAVIWGFSQDGKTWFTGTQAYIAQWCGATTRTVRNVIESLISKGLIEKREHIQKGVTFCDYRVPDRVAQISTLRKNFPHPQEKFSDTYNNPYSNNPSDIDSNESISSPHRGEVEQIVDYLNARTGKHFLASAKATQRKINARLKEGRTVDDFIKVIDTKSTEWLGTKWEKFLSPDTLFGEKFERYLNEAPAKEESKAQTQGYQMKRVRLEDFD